MREGGEGLVNDLVCGRNRSVILFINNIHGKNFFWLSVWKK